MPIRCQACEVSKKTQCPLPDHPRLSSFLTMEDPSPMARIARSCEQSSLSRFTGHPSKAQQGDLPARWETLRLAAFLGPALILANSTTSLRRHRSNKTTHFVGLSLSQYSTGTGRSAIRALSVRTTGVLNHTLAEAKRGITCRHRPQSGVVFAL
jgi:hypothetical protein